MLHRPVFSQPVEQSWLESSWEWELSEAWIAWKILKVGQAITKENPSGTR